MNNDLDRYTGGSAAVAYNPGGFRGRREERAAELAAYLTGRRLELKDANRDAHSAREHEERMREACRIAERTTVGTHLIVNMVHEATRVIAGDEVLAHYLAPILQRGSERITDQV